MSRLSGRAGQSRLGLLAEGRSRSLACRFRRGAQRFFARQRRYSRGLFRRARRQGRHDRASDLRQGPGAQPDDALGLTVGPRPMPNLAISTRRSSMRSAPWRSIRGTEHASHARVDLHQSGHARSRLPILTRLSARCQASRRYADRGHAYELKATTTRRSPTMASRFAEEQSVHDSPAKAKSTPALDHARRCITGRTQNGTTASDGTIGSGERVALVIGNGAIPLSGR